MKIQYDGKFIEMEKTCSWINFYCFKLPIEIPNNINVYSSNFGQEKPDTRVFYEHMIGVTFYNCNLDNCVIPPGNTVVGGSQRRYICQNDLEDWVIDQNNNPIEPVNKKTLVRQGYSVDPKHIPVEKISCREKMPKLADIISNKIPADVKIRDVNFFEAIAEEIL